MSNLKGWVRSMGWAERRDAHIHPDFFNALTGRDARGVRVPSVSPWDLARKVIREATPEDAAYLHETLTECPYDVLYVYFHDDSSFPDDADGARRRSLLDALERRLDRPVTSGAARSSVSAASAGAARQGAKPDGVRESGRRAALLHRELLRVLQGLDRSGRLTSAPRWVLARAVIEQADLESLGSLRETLTHSPGDPLTLYFRINAELARIDSLWIERARLLDRIGERLGVAAPPSLEAAKKTTALRPVPPVEHLDSVTEPTLGLTYRVREAAGPKVLVDIVRSENGDVELHWFDFHRCRPERGSTDDYRLRTALDFSLAPSSYKKLGALLSATEWRALWPSPLAPLLARYEARTLEIDETVVIDLYRGLVYQLARQRLDENEPLVDALIADLSTQDRARAYAATLEEASVVRDALAMALGDVQRTLSRGGHAFTFGLVKPALIPMPDAVQQLAASREKRRFERALAVWLASFPLLTRLHTDAITGDAVGATLEKIKSNIRETREKLRGDGIHGPELDPLELEGVRPLVDETLGPRAKAVVESQDAATRRGDWISTGAQFVAGIGLLFVPGGIFVDTAIGAGMVAGQWSEAWTFGRAANTGLHADAGIVAQAQAHGAEFQAVLSTVLSALGAAASAVTLVSRLRKLARAATDAADVAEIAEVADAAEVPGAGGSSTAADTLASSAEAALLARMRPPLAVPRKGFAFLRKFFFGGARTHPTSAEIKGLLDEAWTMLGGDLSKVPREADFVITNPLKQGAAGYFEQWEGKFGEIGVLHTKGTAGSKASTVFHEAMHARIREVFPSMGEMIRDGSGAWTRNPSLIRAPLRQFDELFAYAFGGLGRVKRGAGLADKMLGLLELAMSPISKYGSLRGLERAFAASTDAAIVLYLAYHAHVLYTVAQIVDSGALDGDAGDGDAARTR